MIFKKNTILEINDRNLSIINNQKLKNLKDVNVDLKNRNLYLVVEGERVYIKLLTIPKVKKNKIYTIVKNELRFYFKNIEDLIFDYVISKELNTSYEIIVFCINSKTLNPFKNYINSNTKIKGVNLIQFVFLNYFKKYIKEVNYIMIFYYNSNLYIIDILKKYMLYNTIMKDFNGNEEEFFNEFNYILKSHINFNQVLENIYLVNFQFENIKSKISKKYNCKELKYDGKEILSYLLRSWRGTIWRR
ncbi:hypothetical protein [Haloimpatiens myeolchijeotgali]|uniref:hypothetical protein n=1 Tax=Haloimpatiens sp. FM7330 TaxID=3298610 RepID=UPI00384B556C